MAARFVILVLMVSLAGCASVRMRLASWVHGRRATPVMASAPTPLAPKPADGLWAILDPGCPKPTLANFPRWPKCASPFWINRDSAMVVRTEAGPRRLTPDHSYRTDYRLAAGNPVIAQIGDDRAGYLYLALTELARDSQGRLVSAAGLPFACPSPSDGAISVAPNLSGCASQSPTAIRKLAFATLQDHAELSRVAWIAPGAP
ncbi:MAG TPA: hypothetical protein VII73_13115 [Caulobacteraceae bacterium]